MIGMMLFATLFLQLLWMTFCSTCDEILISMGLHKLQSSVNREHGA